MPKINYPQQLSQNADLRFPPILSMADALELYPSSNKISDAEADDLQIPGFSPLQEGDNIWWPAPIFTCLDPRVPGIAGVAFFQHIRAKHGPS
jgi:hypothetical protein